MSPQRRARSCTRRSPGEGAALDGSGTLQVSSHRRRLKSPCHVQPLRTDTCRDTVHRQQQTRWRPAKLPRLGQRL